MAPNGDVAIELLGSLLTAQGAAALLQDADPKGEAPVCTGERTADRPS
jgi:hypothetical protein